MSCDIDDVVGGLYKPASSELEYMLDKIGEAMTKDCTYVSADALGLDIRCGRLYVGPDFIACTGGNDRTLQYYGGFEYINKDYRRECGAYVFYYAEADRVRDAMDHFENSNQGDQE